MASSLLNTPAVLWVWLQTDGLMAQSNKQSFNIRFKCLSALWKTRREPLLYLCHNDYAIWVCDIERAQECVVIQPCTSALPAAHRDPCLPALWLSPSQTEVCQMVVHAFCPSSAAAAYSLFADIRACAALCSNSHRNLPPHFITRVCYLPLSHFDYFFLILQPISLLPSDRHPSKHFKQLLVFVEA